MTPLEKANQLIDNFSPYMYCYMGSGMLSNEYDKDVVLSHAKACSIFLVDEIIATDMLIGESTYVDTVSYLGFWEAVKKELESK